MITRFLDQLRRLKLLFRFFIPNTKKQGLFTAIFVFAVIMVFVLIPNTSFAQGGVISNAAAFGMNLLIEFVSHVLLWLARIFISLTVFALKFFVELAKYNGYVDAPVVQIGWLMVRDVANMFFVVVLLVIAFGTILGLEQYEWKKTLVNFILAAVFVNFSKLICGLIIDAAHVFTITFLNAIIAVAGGNLINMFHLDQIMQIVGNDATWGQDVGWALFGGAVMTLVFSGMAMMAMVSYTIVMLYRLVVLWVAIVLSPLAYILAVLPQTKSYAQEWWSEFGKHVMVAPVIVFFLWLAFAALGSGNFVADLKISLEGEQDAASAIGIEGKATTAVSISKVSTWENMANFFIAIAFLMVGLERVQKLGVRGGEYASKAIDFGKSVATIASGYAASRWLVGGAAKGAMGLAAKGAKGALWYAPGIGGEKWAMRAKNFGHGVKGWYYGKGYEVTKEGQGILKNLNEDRKKLADAKSKKIEMSKEDQSALETKIEQQEEELKKYMGGGFVGKFARSGISLEKQAAKTEKQAENRRQLLWKRTGSESGGYIIGMGTKGIGFGKYRFGGDAHYGADSQDRVERGELQGEEMRAKAKDQEYEAMGKNQVLGNARLKFDVKERGWHGLGGTAKFEFAAGTVAERIAEHEMIAQIHNNTTTKLQGEAKLRLQMDDRKVNRGKIEPGLAYSYAGLSRSQAEANTANEIAKENEKQKLEDAQKGIYRSGTDLDAIAQQLLNGRYDQTMQKLFGDKTKIEKDEKELRQELGLSGLDTELKTLLGNKETKQKAVQDAISENEFVAGQKEGVKNLRQEYNTLSKNKKRSEEENNRLKELSGPNGLLVKAEEDLKEYIDLAIETEAVASLQKEFDSASVAVATKQGQIRNLEKNLEKGEGGVKPEQAKKWQDFLARKKANSEAIQDRKSGGLTDMANKLRSGDTSIIDNTVKKMEEEIAEADARGDKSLADEIRANVKKWLEAKNNIKDGVLAWKYGAAKGKGADITRGFRYAHNLLTSEAEQREVFDARGLSTPKNTLNEGIEEYSKSFGEMSIDDYVLNAGSMLLKMMEKQKAGTMTEQDRMALMGLHKRGFDRAWIDDTITALWNNPEAREKFADQFGWKDEEYTDEKIRDISMLFASGGDVEFAKKNAVNTTIMDSAVHDFKMTEAEAIEGLRTGVFKDQATTDKLKETIEKQMHELSIEFGEEQKKMFKDVFEAAGDKDARFRTSANTSSWIQTMRERQSEFQYMGNLRSEALKGGHPENAGWALTKDIGGGDAMYIGMGVRSARNHVFGDLRKMSIRDRASMQSHAFGYLDENNGQVFTRVTEDRYADLLSGIDPRSFANYVNTRLLLHMQGLSGADKSTDFVKDGYFQAGRMFDDKGNLTRAGKTWAAKLEVDNEFKVEFRDAKTQEEQQAVMSKAITRRVFAAQGRGKIEALTMALASAAGVSPYTASTDGIINTDMYVPHTKEWKHYNTINEFVTDFNAGLWHNGKPLEGKERMKEFVPTKDPKAAQNVQRMSDE